MSRLYDRVISEGCRLLTVQMLYDSGHEMRDAVRRIERGEISDTLDEVRQQVAHAKAHRSLAVAEDRFDESKMAGAVVLAADEVGRYWHHLRAEQEQSMRLTDLVASVAPPFRAFWVEFQRIPNDPLDANAWGVLFREVIEPGKVDVSYETDGKVVAVAEGVWVVSCDLVVEFRKGRPVGRVASWTLTLDPTTGELLTYIAQDGEEKAPGGGGLVPIKEMPEGERNQWTQALLHNYLAPALLAVSLLHCRNVDRVEHQPSEKLSKAHQRRSGKPLTRYWTLDIDPMRQVLEADGDLRHSGLRHALHICRGHFKTYTPDAPLFGQHTGTYWWPSYARGDRKLGEIAKEYRIRIEHDGLGRPAVERDEHPELLSAGEGRGEPDLSGRGLAAHRRLENLVMEAAHAAGYQPRDPTPDEPQYDRGWETPDAIWIVEVKSLTPENEESQLRAGLAQLLRYRQLLDAGDREIRCVLAVEIPPTDTISERSWMKLCDDEGIILTWPETFDQVIAQAGTRGESK